MHVEVDIAWMYTSAFIICVWSPEPMLDPAVTID